MTVALSSVIGESIHPEEVLYYYDEPLIFVTRNGAFPLLCLKVDENRLGNIFLCVSTSDTITQKLQQGKLSLKAAFSQPWCFIIGASSSYTVNSVNGVDISEIPEEFMPDPGIGLYPEHGIIVDQFYQTGDRSAFLKISFKGGVLGDGLMPLDLFKGLIDEVYTSVRKVFIPALARVTDSLTSDALMSRLLSIPIQQPVFASLSISLERPQVDLSSVKRNTRIDADLVQESFTTSAAHFASTAIKINDLSGSERSMNNSFVYNELNVLEILASISPGANTPFESLELSGTLFSADSQKIVINREKGSRIADAYRDLSTIPGQVDGRVVEVSARSASFIISTGDREVTCAATSKVLSAAIGAFTAGERVKVYGDLTRRVRRDYLTIDAIELPDGTLIRRRDD